MLPCFKGIWSCPGGKGSPLPTESTANTSTRTEESLPDAFIFSCLPPSLASHVTLRMGSNQRKARPGGEDPSTQKSDPPLLLSRVGGDKLRGAEKGAIQSTAAEEHGRRGCGTRPTPPAPRAPLALGVRLASAGRREKKTNKTKQKN